MNHHTQIFQSCPVYWMGKCTEIGFVSKLWTMINNCFHDCGDDQFHELSTPILQDLGCTYSPIYKSLNAGICADPHSTVEKWCISSRDLWIARASDCIDV